VLDAGQVDLDGRRVGRLLRLRVPARCAAARDERIRVGLAQGDKVRAGAEGEPDVGLHLIEVRGEVALADEVQVPAAGVEGGAAVVQHRLGDLERTARRDLGDLDRRGARRVRERVREPAAVRRPGEILDPLEPACVDLRRRRVRPVGVHDP